MTEAANTTILNGARSAASAGSAVRRELLGWAWLAVGALAVAGVFAILLALSRIPGMEKTPFWPIDFFYKGLVIHVIFSLVIWLQGVFAFLVAVATLKLAGDDVRLAPLGRMGQGAVLVAFPCLFAPAFLDATQPALDNYIPLILHPAYDVGLLALALGVLAPVVRLLINLPGRLASAPPLAVAMALGGFIYLLALTCFGVAGSLLADEGGLAWSREGLFWGGGHLLQFVYAALLVTNWSILARMSLGEGAVDNRVFLACVLLIALIALPAPLFYAAFEPFSGGQHEAFRLLQFGIAAPTLIFAASLLARALRSASPWPWRDPAFFALATSLALFALGGVMGFLITGSDTRTPAHYHAVITAVSVSSAGMLLTFGLKELGRASAPPRATRILLGLYGGGQFVASIAMFVAGGYGALRKTPSGAGSLDAVAAAGMAVHGVASIFTIIGGAAFVVIAIRALMRADAMRSAGVTPRAPRATGGNMKPTSSPDSEAASASITKRIKELRDWRGETLAHVRKLIHDADPAIEEEWKWAKATSPGTPVWSHDGIVCTGESYKEVVKLTFARGASLEDPKKLFNSSLEGNTRRAIDLREGDKIDEAAFKQLIRAAIAANAAARAERAAKKK